jgi:alpha-beta hydrolase superfamily lysophospholipase
MEKTQHFENPPLWPNLVSKMYLHGSPWPSMVRGFFLVLLFVVPAHAQMAAAPQRFTVPADGHPMAVWARIPATPRAAILLVHGRTWSSRPDFDLQVPGLKRSVMQSLADRGIAAYAVDLRGYGETPRDATGWNTPKRAAADVSEVLRWIATRHPSLDKPALLGWSNGAAVAQLVAQQAPARLSSVILFGFIPEPEYSMAPVEAPKVAPKVKNTPASAASDFITPEVTPPAVVRAFVAAALAADPIFAEWKNEDEFSLLRADKVMTPIMLLHGDNDPGLDSETAGRFLAAVGSPNRAYVVLPFADHAAQLEDTHEAWVSAVAEFITRPGAVRR